MPSPRENDRSPALPPGQRELAEFPRFGVVSFARRSIRCDRVHIEIAGALVQPVALTAAEFATLPRVSLTADFHCAAGWSHRAARWSGFRMKDVWDTFVAPCAPRTGERSAVVLRGLDGYRTSLPLADLLAPDVLLADRLNEAPLTIAHGAPLRLVAPAHYGYKSTKHLAGIRILEDGTDYRTLLPRFMEHPRARVAYEERGQWLPGWLLRYAFRPFIRPMIRRLQQIDTPTMHDGP